MSEASLPPLYEQIRRRILSQIEAGIFAEGAFLPPEAELCAQLGVSRITLRRAVGELCASGQLIRQQGRGTLVAARKLQQPISLNGFADAVEGMGRKASHRVLACEAGPADLPGFARLNARQPLRYDRLLLVDGQPMMLEALWFDAARFGAIRPELDGGGSFFAALRQSYGITPAGAEREIDVGFASAAEASLLGGATAQPVYRIDKLVTAERGDAIAWSQVVIPCNRVTLRLVT